MIPAQRAGRHDDTPPPYSPATLDAAIAGDPDAFAELWRAHRLEVFRYAYYRLPNRATAEDIASETFLRALRRIGTFTEIRGGGMSGWLITIARNLIADHFKSSRYRREYLDGEMRDGDLVTGSAEDEAVQAIAAETVQAAVWALNPHQRAVIHARYLDELSVAETAELLDSNDGAIKTTAFRAVRTLARDPRLSKELLEQ